MAVSLKLLDKKKAAGTPYSRMQFNSGLGKKIWDYRAIYLMMLPALIGFAIFSYGPMYGIQLAFKDYWVTKGISGSPFVGFKHFQTIFSLDKFYQVMGNTISINLLRLFFGFPAPIILALLLNELGNTTYKKIIQTILYLPHFISWVVIAGIIFALLGNDGLINQIIASLGGEKQIFLLDKGFFRPLIISSGIWKEIGWGTIIYLAALAGINPALYESANLDGAGRFQKMRYITLPSLLPTISILLIFECGKLMTAGFDQIFNLYNEAVYSVGDVIDTYIYRIGIEGGKFEMGTAVGLFLNVINLFLLVAVNKISKKLSGNGIY